MVVGAMPEAVDLLVVGGGPGGYAAAIRAAQAGRSVALVDRDEWSGLGGSCLHVGCIPSKALIDLALAASASTPGATPGLQVSDVTVDLGAFQVHKDQLVGRLARGVESLVRAGSTEVISGTARLVGPRQAAVVAEGAQPRYIDFEDAIVAVGSRPVGLDVLPFDGERILDSAGVLGLDVLPASLCIVGGGYIGLEIGMALARLGTKVTIVEALDRVAPAFEPDVSALIATALERLDVTVHVGATIGGIDERHLLVAVDGTEHRVECERVMVAAGRRPNTDDLGLDQAGARVDTSGRIDVDRTLLAAPHVAAIGDAVAGPALAHKATLDADTAVGSLGGAPTGPISETIPVVMFTRPEVAVAGMTRAEAEAEGIDVVTRSFPLAALGRAATLGDRHGFARLVSDREDGALIGAQLVGPHASEVIAEAALAIEMGATLDDVALTVHAHPTIAESVGEAAHMSLGRPLHVPMPARAVPA